MEQIILVEPSIKYVEEIWRFRQEILEQDIDNEDIFAGCISLDECNYHLIHILPFVKVMAE